MKKMKKKNQSSGKTGRNHPPHPLLAKALATEKLAEAARQNWHMVKLEQKQARKAFKQAKKAAKLARKEAKVAMKTFKRNGKKSRKANPLKAKSISPGRAARPAHTPRIEAIHTSSKIQVPAVIPPVALARTEELRPSAANP